MTSSNHGFQPVFSEVLDEADVAAFVASLAEEVVSSPATLGWPGGGVPLNPRGH